MPSLVASSVVPHAARFRHTADIFVRESQRHCAEYFFEEGMTKIKYNSCNFDGGPPVAVRVARMVGEVQTMGSAKGAGRQAFIFYVWLTFAARNLL